MRALLCIAVLLGSAAAQAKCFTNTERWTYDRGKETLAAAGERFFADMQACDPGFAASVTEAVRYQIHKEEVEKYTRSKSYVFAAYGVAWALLAFSAVAVWLRQRKLTAEIAALEARVRAAEKA
jgi:hypothetical protein